MNGLSRINREAAEELFSRFAPMFANVGILGSLAAEGGAGADGVDNNSASPGGLLSRLSGILGDR